MEMESAWLYNDTAFLRPANRNENDSLQLNWADKVWKLKWCERNDDCNIYIFRKMAWYTFDKVYSVIADLGDRHVIYTP